MAPPRDLYSSAAVCALMVMPRSRSRSMESSTWSPISRSERPPQSWIKRSASVDLPWSMCAMMEKLRMRFCSINKEGAEAPSMAAILPQGGSLPRDAPSPLVRKSVDRDESHRVAAPHLQREYRILVQRHQDLVQLFHRADVGVLALVHDAEQDIAAPHVGAHVRLDLGHQHDAGNLQLLLLLRAEVADHDAKPVGHGRRLALRARHID